MRPFSSDQYPTPSSMSSPAPLLRPPIPGSRANSASRTPRLGLAIPPSPNAKPVNQNGTPGPPPQLRMPSRPSLPQLSLATPMGSNSTPYEIQSGRPSAMATPGQSASGGSESSMAHSRTGSFGPLDGRASGPTSAGSQYSSLSFTSQHSQAGRPLRINTQTPEQQPSSAIGSIYSETSEGGIGMQRDGSMNGLPDINSLSLEKGRTLDVDELDDDAWLVASSERRIEELGSLGEGAGGAVTRCKLRGGKIVFALKVYL